jgi:hypothetical protein
MDVEIPPLESSAKNYFSPGSKSPANHDIKSSLIIMSEKIITTRHSRRILKKYLRCSMHAIFNLNDIMRQKYNNS